MEKENKDLGRFKELRSVSDKDQEKARIISELLLKFETDYLEVVTGSKDKADLYSGDFEAKKDPLSLILSNENDNLTVVEYDFLVKRFADIIKDDLKHESNSESITKYPDPKTKKLRDFLKDNPGKALSAIHTDIKLKSDEKNSILILAIDRYYYPKDREIPITETWTLRRMQIDTDGSGESDFSKKYRVMARPIVRTASIPQLTSGK